MLVSGGLRAATLISLLETRSPFYMFPSFPFLYVVSIVLGGKKHRWKVFNTLAVEQLLETAPPGGGQKPTVL